MTFLEYVAERLMGQPARRTATYGESYWRCPHHGGDSFHTKPHKLGYKDGWCCFGCGAWGDEYDLMKLLMPPETWPARQARMEQWRQEYQRAVSQPAPVVGTAKVFISGESGRLVENQDHPLAVAAAWADLMEGEREILIAAYLVMRGNDRLKTVSQDALARYCFDFVECMREMEAAHLRECTDAECDAPVCRRAWGDRPGAVKWILPEPAWTGSLPAVGEGVLRRHLLRPGLLDRGAGEQ